MYFHKYKQSAVLTQHPYMSYMAWDKFYQEYVQCINVLTQLVLFFYENNFVIVISGHF